MPGKIFISYRREDSAGHAGRVHDRLQNEFSSDLVFMDVDAVPLGANFLKVLQDAVANCDVLLAVIGPSWLHACDREGKRRLENPNDYVRIEIAAALERDIPVIPILIDRTQIPPLEELPDDIRSLALRNGLDVRHGSFHADMGKLVKVLRGLVAVQREQASARMFGGTATAKEPRPSLPVALARRIAGARVLWVDDHPENNDYEQRVLESLGIDFVRSLDTEDALDNLQREQFDLI